MYRFNWNGMPVECETIAELQEALGAGAQTGAITPTPYVRKRRPPAPGKSPGSGPAKSWRIAEWYAQENKISRNEARSVLAKIKASDLEQFLKLLKKYESQKGKKQPA